MLKRINIILVVACFVTSGFAFFQYQRAEEYEALTKRSVVLAEELEQKLQEQKALAAEMQMHAERQMRLAAENAELARLVAENKTK